MLDTFHPWPLVPVRLSHISPCEVGLKFVAPKWGCSPCPFPRAFLFPLKERERTKCMISGSSPHFLEETLAP